ncbi:type II restriction endonuclease [Bacteroides sp. 214]|nr:TaqI-like C-terminal specificity domain-containing protein [Bacteroides sp. 214]NDW11838.1 type II restriction endonuclease [Bacteroides sp. 214]
MSVFVEQHYSVCDFSEGASWTILSPIEQSIKRKIESVGTPLKDWDINIYRGVLTGYNEAFIISTEKRDEILANCQTEDEKMRTAEIIRPILRGRDIRRYGYNWANLWLINTHNGTKEKFPRILIEDYPALKAHLDQYLDKISKRADQGDTPYNLRNCAYLEDFDKPKIIYPNMTKYMPFVYDEDKFVTNQKCFIITGQNMAYLTAFFNSSIFKFCFRDSFPELQGGTRELSKIFFDKIPVKKISGESDELFKTAINRLQSDYTKEQTIVIDNMLFDLYDLTVEERKVIGNIEIK